MWSITRTTSTVFEQNLNNVLSMQVDDMKATSYVTWRLESIKMMKEKLQHNVAARSKKVEEVVNNCVININKELQLGEDIPNQMRFYIANDLILSSLEQMFNKLNAWNGVNIASCKQKPSTFDEYWYIADNWWNRQKGCWFGAFYFYKLFHSLYEYCNVSSCNNLLYGDILFYNILHDIFDANVSFKRARPQPLVFDQSLDKSTELKHYFMQLFGLNMKRNKKDKKYKLRITVLEHIIAIKDRKFKEYFHLKYSKNNQNGMHRPSQSQVVDYVNHRQMNEYRQRPNHQNKRYQTQQQQAIYHQPIPIPIPIPRPINVHYSRSTSSTNNPSNTTPISLCSTMSPASFPCIAPTYHRSYDVQSQRNSNDHDDMTLSAYGIIYGDDENDDPWTNDPFFGTDTVFAACAHDDMLSVFPQIME